VKKVAVTFLVAVILVALVCVLSVNRKFSQQAKARNIKLGDTKAEVERQLGKATAVERLSTLWRSNATAALFCDTTEAWAYGDQLDFKSKFPWIRVRMFLPHPDDIAVEFDRSNRVVRVTIP
jgi:hypothetical protein